MPAIHVHWDQKLNEFALEQSMFRFPEGHEERSYYKKQLNNLRAGADGEKRVLETVRSIGLPEESEIVTNINLPLTGGLQFQIDLAIITRSGILLLEVKQIGGRLRFHRSPSDLRKVDESGKVIQIFDCPVAQLNDQIENLSHWLSLIGLKTNIQGVVTFANNPIIEEIPPGMPVIKMRELRNTVRSHLKMPPLTDSKTVKVTAKTLKYHSVHYLPYPFQKQRDLVRAMLYIGPICIYCGESLKKLTERMSFCAHCEKAAKNLYLETLLVWFLLISPTITPRKCKELFQVETYNSVRRILSGFPVRKTGKRGYVTYHVHYPDLLRSQIVQQILNDWFQHKQLRESRGHQ